MVDACRIAGGRAARVPARFARNPSMGSRPSEDRDPSVAMSRAHRSGSQETGELQVATAGAHWKPTTVCGGQTSNEVVPVPHSPWSLKRQQTTSPADRRAQK